MIRTIIDPQSVLTPRQKQVLRLVSTGMSNDEIADELSIAIPTVQHHVVAIFDRLGCHNRVQAAVIWTKSRCRMLAARGALV